MKRVTALVLAAAMPVVMLAGCGNTGYSAGETKTKDIMTQFTVETETLEREWYADDKTTLLAKYEYEVPHIVPEDGEAENVTAMADTFNETVDAFFTDLADSFEETAQYAEDQYKYELEAGFTEKGKWDMYYTDEIDCAWNSVGNVLSVQKSYYAFAGGAHGYSYISAWNYDVENAKFITDVTTLGENSQEFHDAVTSEILRQVNEEVQPEMVEGYWDDYETIISNWNVDYYTWFTGEGMYVSFPAYSLAPYAAGEQQFLIGFDLIEQYLSDKGKHTLGIG